MYLGVTVSPKELAQRAESLVRQSSNRYLTTVRIAFRASSAASMISTACSRIRW